MVRTIAVRGGPFFYFVFVLFECARVESQPEAPFESIRNGWMLLFLFCLGSLVFQSARRLVRESWQKSRVHAATCVSIVLCFGCPHALSRVRYSNVAPPP